MQLLLDYFWHIIEYMSELDNVNSARFYKTGFDQLQCAMEWYLIILQQLQNAVIQRKIFKELYV